MLNEIISVISKWRIIHLLGISTLRTRYSRSKFGQAWLSLSTFTQILCIGLIWSLIWKMEIDEYLPYVAAGHIVFLFFSQAINESTGVFVADSRIYLNDKQPFMLSIWSHVYRNVLTLLHNIPTLIIIVIWSESARLTLNWMFFVSLFFGFLFLFFSCYLFAVLATRFRDLIQLVALLMQLAFLVTPVMWKVDFLPLQYQNYVYLNPFAAILELIRNPMIGLDVNSYAMISLIVWTLLMWLLSYISYSEFNKRIIYWV